MNAVEVIMNIKEYFKNIKQKVNKLDNCLKSSPKFDYASNPFLSAEPKTYVWIEDSESSEVTFKRKLD